MWANRNYKRSNKIEEINFDLSEKAFELARAILNSSNTQDRQGFSLELADELCDLAKIEIVNVKISDAKQYHKKTNGRVSMRQYGYYKPDSRYIYITNHTAVRGQPLAPKTFLNTLLHEWMHHYDTYKLKLNSIHTKGFYLRIKSLETQLLNYGR